jgi:benzoyl-CoA reductase subunit C
MPREEHNALMRRVLTLLPQRTARRQDKVRVVFEGGFCEQPPLDMLAAIENACYVVGDDLSIGLRWLTDDVPVEGDPLTTLARAYLDGSSHSPVQHDPRQSKARRLLRRVEASGADAAIIAAPKMCEPGLDEQVHCVRALEAAGIPCLVLEFEETMTVFEQMGMEVETFAESLLFEFA